MRALLVVPSITDFAAHDMWAAPYGLMVIASTFRRYNIDFDVLDLLGRDYVRKEYDDGRRRYKRRVIDMPDLLKGKSIKRFFAIYGADLEEVDNEIARLRDKYDLIIITTTMTYWYYGYKFIYTRLKNKYREAIFAIGGVYPSLIESHARELFYDAEVFPNNRLFEFDKLISEMTGLNFKCFSKPFCEWELPDLKSFEYRRYIPVLLTRGCPFKCTYCASKNLVRFTEHKDSIMLADWVIEQSEKTGIKNVAFFDDAFLYKSDEIAKPFLKRLIQSKAGLRLHASNGLHPRYIDEEMAYLMRSSGFETIRLSLESSNEFIMNTTGGKVRKNEYESAIRYLIQYGYTKYHLGTYLICGLPFQTPQDVLDSIKYVDDKGGTVYLAEYSPIPDTTLFAEAKKIAKYDINEPLWQNNTLMSYWNPVFNEDVLNEIKSNIINMRKKPTTGFEPVTY